MKAALPFGTLVVGIAIGWMLKGSPEATANAGGMEKPAKVEARSSSVAGAVADSSGATAVGKSHERPLKADGPEDDKFAKLAMETASKHIMDAMQERQAKRMEERIAKLVEKLGLDASQTAKLREFLQKQEEATQITVGENGRSVRMNKPGNGASLDDFMKDLLTDPQKESYEQLKETERNQKIEARTLRDMASMTQAVELRPDQRDAVYAILQEQAKNDVASGAPMGMISVGGMPPLEVAAGTSVDSVVAFKVPEGATGGDQAAMDAMREQQQAQIDDKVNRMSGVLDEKQLAAYRASLEQGRMMLPR